MTKREQNFDSVGQGLFLPPELRERLDAETRQLRGSERGLLACCVLILCLAVVGSAQLARWLAELIFAWVL